MSTYSYYPGCSLHKSAQEYNTSTKAVCKVLGIELKELSDWSCCGASPAHHTDSKLAAALGARNLNLAKKAGLPVVAPCPACFNHLKMAAYELEHDAVLAEKFKNEFDIYFEKPVDVVHILEVIDKLGADKIKQHVKTDLSQLKTVSYYGCLLVRPVEIAIDDLENPTSLDELLGLVNIKTLPWSGKVACCGSTMGVSDNDLINRLTGGILERAHLAGAEAVVVLCPLCHANLDLRQAQVRRAKRNLPSIPVFYFTQLLGLAFGLSPKEVGLNKNIVDPMPLLKKLGIK